MKFTKEQLAGMMDHAVLKPNCTDVDIRKNAEACITHGIGDLCVRPTDVAYAKDLLKGSRVTVAGKPALIAAEVTKGDALLKLRDDSGIPAWAGWRR